ncbi:NUDIX hydrolase [Streptomonospora sediminis]
MAVREDDVVFPDGSPGVYTVVERRDFSLVVPELPDGRLALVRLYRHPVQRWFWEFPQGSSAAAGLSPEEVAVQELREETGFTAGWTAGIGRLHEAYGYATSSCDVYVAGDLVAGPADPEPGETGVRWEAFHPRDIWSLAGRGEVTDAVTVAALGLYGGFRHKGAL